MSPLFDTSVGSLTMICLSQTKFGTDQNTQQ
jgi:hypothetical protein